MNEYLGRDKTGEKESVIETIEQSHSISNDMKI